MNLLKQLFKPKEMSGCLGGTKVPTYTGLVFDPLNPEIDKINIIDIAYHLSHLARFGGATNRMYSVAEHSLMVMALVPDKHKKWALLHDAAEAYCGDVRRPIKYKIRGYRRIENKIEKAIKIKFGLTGDIPPEVKAADNFALGAEGITFFPAHDPWKSFWNKYFQEQLQTNPYMKELWITQRDYIKSELDPQAMIDIPDLFLEAAEKLEIPLH